MTGNFVQIPINKDTKKPIEGIQINEITKTPNKNMFEGNDRANLTGKINDIIVLVINKPTQNLEDGRPKIRGLIHGQPETLRMITKSGELHYYYKYDDEIKCTSKGIHRYAVDVLSNCDYVEVCDINRPIFLADDDDEPTPIQPLPEKLKQFILTWQNKNNNVNKKEKKETSTTIPKSIMFNYNLADIVDVLNKLPPKYYNDFSQWFKITSALKSANLREVWDTFSKKSIKYDEDSNNNIWEKLTPGIDLTYLNVIKRDNKIKSKMNVKRWCNELNLFTATPNETRNDKYIELIISEDTKKVHPNKPDFDYVKNPIILIKSMTGTGKTTAMRHLCKKIMTPGTNYKLLSIVSRKCLAIQHQADFYDEGRGIDVEYYEDISRDDYEKVNLTIQLESIYHIDPHKMKNTILFLDEVHSLIDHLANSDTLKKRRCEVYQRLCMIMLNASYIVGVDSDLSDTVIKFFKSLKLDPYVIHNKYRNATGQATQYKCKDNLIADMKAKLERDEKFICCFDSFTTLRGVVYELKQYCNRKNYNRDFLVYSKEDGDREDFKNVTKTWAGKYVFYSPAIIYGIDFKPKDAMCVYGFFDCQSISPLAFGQMIARCRKIKHLRYFIKERNVNLTFMSAQEIKDNKNDVIKYFKALCDKLDPVDEEARQKEKEAYETKYKDMLDLTEFNTRVIVNSVEISSEIFNDIYWRQAYYNAVMRSAHNYHFQSILKEKGYNDIKVNGTIAKYKIDWDKIKEMVEEDKIKTRDNACHEHKDDLTNKEKIVRTDMEKKADILNINLNNENLYNGTYIKGISDRATFIDEMTDEKKFISHLNLCSIMKLDQDTRFIESTYKDFAVKNISANVFKLKLIDEVHKILNITPFDIDNINEDDYKRIPEDTQKSIRDTFDHKKDINISKMYRHMCPDIISSKQKGGGKNKHTVYKIEEEKISRHLYLLSLRNKFMEGINKDTLNYFEYVPPKKPEKKKK